MLDLLATLGIFPPLILAGATGGGIRWYAVKDQLRDGLVHVLIGAIIGNYFGSAVIGLIDQVAGAVPALDPQALRLLGAHLCGFIGLSVYAFAFDWMRERSLIKSVGKDQQP